MTTRKSNKAGKGEKNQVININPEDVKLTKNSTEEVIETSAEEVADATEVQEGEEKSKDNPKVNLPVNYEVPKYMDLVKKYEGTLNASSEIATRMIDITSGKEVKEALTIITEISDTAKGSVKNESKNFLGKWLNKKRKQAKTKIDEQKNIISIINDLSQDFETSKERLNERIDSLYELADECRENQGMVRTVIAELEQEIELAMAALDEARVSGDTQKEVELGKRIPRFRSLLEKHKGYLTLYQSQHLDIEGQVEGYVAIYEEMSSSQPHIDSIVKGQLATMVSKNDLEDAQDKLRISRELINRLTVENAERNREMIKETAELSFNVSVDAETIDRLKEAAVGALEDIAETIKNADKQMELANRSRTNFAKELATAKTTTTAKILSVAKSYRALGSGSEETPDLNVDIKNSDESKSSGSKDTGPK